LVCLLIALAGIVAVALAVQIPPGLVVGLAVVGLVVVVLVAAALLIRESRRERFFWHR
jgi:hypothetical protein